MEHYKNLISNLAITNHFLDNGYQIKGRPNIVEHAIDNGLNQTVDKIHEFIKERNFNKNFRYHFDAQGVAYTLAVFAQEKLIILGSERFFIELSILKASELDTFRDEQLSAAVNEIREMIDKVVSIQLTDFPSVTKLSVDLPDLMAIHKKDPSIDDKTFKLVSKLAKHQMAYKSSLFEKISDQALGYTAKYAIIRVHILKFLAILTCLDHDKKGEEVKRILIESIRRLLEDNNKAKRNKLKGESSPLPNWMILVFHFKLFLFRLIPAKILAYITRLTVRYMAKRFIAGENITQALNTLEDLEKTNRFATLDQLGELVVSKVEADHYQDEVCKLVQGLNSKYGSSETNRNKAGILHAHVSIKVSALAHNFKPHDFEYSYDQVAPRLIKILKLAKAKNVFINIDAEHYSYRDIVFEIFKKVLLEVKELSDYKDCGIVVQAYLRDSHLHLNDVVELAKTRGIVMPIRLVKGAYWDAETIEANAHNFVAPEFLNKEETDIRFRQLVHKSFEHAKDIQLALASHNIHDHCWAQSLREVKFPHIWEIEHQCLHMTYEALSVGLTKMNWVVRNYVPVGNLLVGMAYLVRRIMENSSQVGILTIMRSHTRLDTYTGPLDALEKNIKNSTLVFDNNITEVSSKFHPVSPMRPYLKFHLENFNQQSNLIDIKTKGNHSVFSNNDLSTEIAQIKFYTEQETTEIINKLSELDSNHFEQSLTLRVSAILALSEYLHLDRNQITYSIMEEVGKSFLESLADVDEAIDFIRFYVEDYLTKTAIKKKDPIGIVGVIAPWNFPLAIPVGMSIAPLICGNRVLLKSSERSPYISEIFYFYAKKAFIPTDSFRHVAGLGTEVGQAFANSQKISSIVFTGSKKIGLDLYSKARGQLVEFKSNKIFKNVIAEMGGKNAIIVTNNSELDETVSGVIYASFAHAGQKCSACSRVIINQEIKDTFLSRFVEASKDLLIADARNLAAMINPVIDEQQKQRILSCVDSAIEEAHKYGGKVLLDKSRAQDIPALCVGPVIIELPAERAFDSNSWAQKEIFGPVVHVIAYKNLRHAVKILNSSEYALTAGIFCQSQDDIDFLLSKIEAGNIYINRPNTGARVAIEPFGGFKMSGTGPKAGGRYYLNSFISSVSPKHAQREGGSQAPVNEEGSDYAFYHPKRSQFPFKKTIKLTSQILNKFLTQFETYLGSFELKKLQLEKFSQWLDQNLLLRLEEQGQNYYTPGQLNQSDLSLVRENTLFVCHNEKPSLKTMTYFFISLALGQGIVVITRNSNAYQFWQNLLKLIRSYGISKDQIDVYLSSKDHLELALSSKSFDMQVVDAALEYTRAINTQSLSKDYFKDYSNKLHMKKIVTNFDGFDETEFDLILSDFIFERSLAINTMRHGAPLELEF